MTLIHGLSYDLYAANDSVRSNHVIAALKSPRRLKDILEGTVKRSTKALQFGTAGHMAVLEPGSFARLLTIPPATYPGAKGESDWTYRADYCKAWRAEREAEGKLVVDPADIARITLMLERMPDEVRYLLSEGAAEVVVRAPVNGVPCQARLDWLGKRLLEVKTTRSVDNLEQTIVRYSYHVQLQFQRHVLKSETGTIPDALLVFVETESPYRWRIAELDMEFQEHGNQAVERGLQIIKQCREDGDWTDTGEIRELVSPPLWMRDGDEDGEPEQEA